MSDRTLLQEFWQNVGQIPAGIAQATVANASTEQDRIKAELRARKAKEAGGVQEFLYNANQYMTDPLTRLGQYVTGDDNYVPAIVKSPGAVVGLVQTLINGDVPSADTYTGDAVQGTLSAYDRTNSYLGLEEPENALQVMMNVAGQLAVPGPKIAGATSKLGKAAQIGGELFLPLRNTPMKTALPVAGGLSVGINEFVNTADDDYTGISDLYAKPALLEESVAQTNLQDMLERGAPYEQIIKYADEQQIKVDEGALAQAISQRDQAIIAQMQAAIQSGATTEQLQALAKSLGGTYQEGDRSQPLVLNASGLPTVNDTEATFGEKAVIGLGAGAVILGGAALAATAVKAVSSGLRQPPPSYADGVTGTRTFKRTDGVVSQIDTAVADHLRPIREVAKNILSPEATKKVNYSLDLISSQSTGTITSHNFNTGEYPNSAITVQAVGPILEAFSKELSDVEKQMVTDALLYKTVLDDYNRTGVQAALNDVSIADMKKLINTVEYDPKLGKYADAFRDQFSGSMKFLLDQGLITPKAYYLLRQLSPNHVPLRRSVINEGQVSKQATVGDDGSRGIDELFSRAEAEWEGPQVGAVANPIDKLPDTIGSIIKYATINNFRRDFFAELMRSGADKVRVPASDGQSRRLLKEITDPDKAAKAERVITVYEAGEKKFYQVGDPALYNSIMFAPRATMPILGQARGVFQSLQTGTAAIVSQFAATISPFLESQAIRTLKPKGYKYNMADVLLGPVLGGGKNFLDELKLSVANSLTEQLIRDNGYIRNLLGKTKTTAWRDKLMTSYDNSIKSIMDEMGVTSRGVYGGDTDTVKSVPTSMQDIAPSYYKDLATRMYNDAVNGEGSAVKIALETSKYLFHRVKASTISRMYVAVIRNMQEGSKHHFMSKNFDKVLNAKTVTDKEKALLELAAVTRTVGIDNAKYGGNETISRILDSVPYANVGIQSLAAHARAAKSDPLLYTYNTMSTVAMLAALRYGSIAVDQEVRQIVSNKSPSQNASSVTMFGGIDIPIEHMYRPIVAPLFATLDAMAVDEQGNINENFMQVWANYFEEGSTLIQDERMKEAASTGFKLGVSANNPINPNDIPLVNVLLSLNGVDTGMSRISSEPQQIKSQTADPSKGSGKFTDSLTTAQTESIINGVLGSTVGTFFRMADDIQRALDGTTAFNAARVGLQTYEDAAARTRGPAQSLLFGDYQRTHGLRDIDYLILEKKSKGIELADTMFDREIMQKMRTNADKRLSRIDPVDIMKPEYENTYLAPIGILTQELNKDLGKLDDMLTPINRQIEEYRAGNKITDRQSRNAKINQLNEERRYINMQKLALIRIQEDKIRETIGDPSFTYQDFEIEKYNKPIN